MAYSWIATMALPRVARTEGADADEAALIAGCRRGDEHSFALLVRRHQRRVFRLAGRFFRRPEEIEEIAQETFFAAWRKLATYRAEAPFEHWLTRVCLNCCYASLRRRRPVAVDMPADVVAPPTDRDAPLEVGRLLGHLEPDDRFMLLLLHGEEWSVEEIARRLGWSRVTVKVRAHRARKRLRRLLEEGTKP